LVTNGDELMKRRTLYVIGAVAVVAVILGIALLWTRQARSSEEEEVRSAVVERGTMLVAVSASGSVEPEAQVSLEFEQPSGRVAEVRVGVGDAVAAGDVLAQLDTRRLALQVEQAQAALASAEAQLAQLQDGARPEEVAAAEANLRAAQAQVSAAAANRDQVETGPSQAQIAGARSQVAAAELQVKLARDRYDTTSGDEKRKEQARYDLWAAEKALAAAQAELDRLLAGADADEVRGAQANVSAAAAQRDAAQAQLDQLVGGATEAEIMDAEAQVTQAQAALEEAKLLLARATLRAPFDGVVAAVNVTAGEMVPVGLPAITLLDTSTFRVTVGVDEIDVGRLAGGQTAEVALDALPELTFSGSVERIAPAATFEGGVVYYDVLIELDSTDAPIRADMTANATIVVDKLTDVLMIPTWVVHVDRDTGQTYVDRQIGDDVERVDVALGVRYGGFVQVLGGLSEGDEVLWVPNDRFNFGGQG
jgi:HlyD family secretion protein